MTTCMEAIAPQEERKITIITNEESYQMMKLLAERSPQQDIPNLIKYLVEREIWRVSEFDSKIREELCRISREKREG